MLVLKTSDVVKGTVGSNPTLCVGKGQTFTREDLVGFLAISECDVESSSLSVTPALSKDTFDERKGSYF